MKIFKLVICCLALFLISGCSNENTNKTVTIKDIDPMDVEVYTVPSLSTAYNAYPYDMDLNGISENAVLGSILDKTEDNSTFQTEMMFAYKNDDFIQYKYLKENRVIDYTIVEDVLFYLTYFIVGNEIHSELYKYMDGENDEFVEQFESDSFYNPPEIIEYEGGFVIVIEGAESSNIYKYSNKKLETIYSKKNTNENLVPSLSQAHNNILYTVIAEDSGNTIVEIDLNNNEVKEYATNLKFGRYSVMDDYIVIFDENNKREIVYDREMKEQWTSDLNVEIVRWVSYASGNTLVYSDNMSHDLFVRNYNNDNCYRISAESENLLHKMPVAFYVDGNTIYTKNMDTNTLLTIMFSKVLSE